MQKTLRAYLKPGVQRRRALLTVLGVCATGVAAGMIKRSAFGVDPFQCLMNGLHNIIPIPFGTFYVLINLVMLLIVFLMNRHYIGLGTLINLFFLGYILDAVEQLLTHLAPQPTLGLRIGYLLCGLVILCVGGSLYFTADLGVSTYDAYALHFSAKKPKTFRIIRIGTDLLCVISGLLLGWKPGVGTVICAFATGPLIAWCNEHIAIPLLKGAEA